MRNVAPPDLLMCAAAALLAAAGVVAPAQALSGFANEGTITVAALFVVAAALRETAALDRFGGVLGTLHTERQALRRMSWAVTGLSAFLNNTAVVAMLLPGVVSWCRRNGVSPSRLLLPLSFLTVLGGTCTLIGTSTNLVVDGLMHRAARSAVGGDAAAFRGIGIFEVTPVGVALAAVGAVYLMTLGRRLLPDRRAVADRHASESREYLVNMRLEQGAPLVGKTVERAGLRRLQGLFLIEIVREGHVIAPVGPEEELRAGDRLTFVGAAETIVDLERIPGLVALVDEPRESPEANHERRHYCEAVVSTTSPVVGVTIRDSNFRARYNAVVLAVHRGGERLRGRVGDIVLQPGDTLLLQTGPHFEEAHRNNPDFILVSLMQDARPVRHGRAGVAVAVLGGMLLVAAVGLLPVVVAALLAAVAVIVLRCISTGEARRAIQWDVLITIAAAFGIGQAMESSGLAATVAEAIVAFTRPLGPLAVLAAIYLATMMINEVITNNAAAALMFPLAVASAAELEVSPRPFVMAVLFAASLSFATPIGYQTNLMVFGPGGYRFSDFVRVGLPLNLLLAVCAIALIPLYWPLVGR